MCTVATFVTRRSLAKHPALYGKLPVYRDESEFKGLTMRGGVSACSNGDSARKTAQTWFIRGVILALAKGHNDRLDAPDVENH